MRRCLIVGTINHYPAPEGWEYVHVDLSGRLLYDVATGASVPVDVQADMRDLPFNEASVDRVQTWHSLEHVTELGGRQAVAEFARVLRPGGVLDVCVPDLGGLAGAPAIEPLLTYVYGQQFEMEDAELNVHRWGYTERSLTDLLIDSGFGKVRRVHDGDLHLLAERV